MPAGFQWHSPFCSAMNQDNNTTDLSRNSAVREVWIDWIRAVGSVGIVALHVVTREKFVGLAKLTALIGGHLPLTKQ